ncbi:hypothetical protein [Pectinatus frisingensis]|uniref:hypothetical protein n=1 Tax=Pectinatus frisingensis TaxID=865 RepID=UPI0018C56477|nr:hypothetical protein [Pectinatus frisingensis]
MHDEAIETKRKALRQQIKFRGAMLLISLVIVIPYFMGYLYNPILITFFVSLATSLFAWDIVAIWDLMTNTYAQYKNERKDFCEQICQHMNNIIKNIWSFDKEKFDYNQWINFFKNNNTNELWDTARKEFLEMYDYMDELVVEQKIYILSSEYLLFKNYIKRCFWLLEANKYYSYPSEPLFEKFIFYDRESVRNINTNYIINSLNSINNIPIGYEKLKNIELNDEELSIPKGILISQLYSIIYKKPIIYVNKAIKRTEVISFIPCIRFEKISLNENYSMFKLFIDILGYKCPIPISYLKKVVSKIRSYL